MQSWLKAVLRAHFSGFVLEYLWAESRVLIADIFGCAANMGPVLVSRKHVAHEFRVSHIPIVAISRSDIQSFDHLELKK